MHFDELMARPHRWARLLGWTTLAGLICGLIGPYGSYPANGASRILFWVTVFWMGTLILWPTVAAAMLFGARRGIPPLFAGTVAALAACVPLALCAAFACAIFWPVHASGIRPQEWYGLTVIIALPAIALVSWLEELPLRISPARAAPAAISAEGCEDGVTPAAVASDRLPEHMLELVQCLQMEDHHVRVHTSGGSFLQLASMREAADQLAARGLQVHRSWWVARSAVASWFGDARALTLVLRNGLQVPVARNRIATVRAEGWLNGPGRQQESVSTA